MACPPEEVQDQMKELLNSYHSQKDKTIEDIIEFHYQFECIELITTITDMSLKESKHFRFFEGKEMPIS